MILARYVDDEYEGGPITRIRHTVRVFLHTQNNTYLFVKLHGEDEFGSREGIESIGGGMEGFETFEETLRREVREETGLEIESYKLIGTIIDRYNLLNRENHAHFFVGEVDTTKQGETHKTKLEETLIEGVVELTYTDALKELTHPKNKISKLIYRRDLLAFEQVKHME